MKKNTIFQGAEFIHLIPGELGKVYEALRRGNGQQWVKTNTLLKGYVRDKTLGTRITCQPVTTKTPWWEAQLRKVQFFA